MLCLCTYLLSFSDESSSEWDSKGSGREGGTPSPSASPQHPPVESPAVSYKHEQESPWDRSVIVSGFVPVVVADMCCGISSEDDSIEELAAEQLTGRTSSTPIKVNITYVHLLSICIVFSRPVLLVWAFMNSCNVGCDVKCV